MIRPGTALSEVKAGIIRPALTSIGLGTEAAINLITGVGLAESAYRTLRQYGGGPALGYWQMEPATHDDCWKNFLAYRPMLEHLVIKIAGTANPTAQLLTTNDAYAAVMARVRFFRSRSPIPPSNDPAALCWYWKAVYNTGLGAGDVDASHIALFQRGVNGCGFI